MNNKKTYCDKHEQSAKYKAKHSQPRLAVLVITPLLIAFHFVSPSHKNSWRLPAAREVKFFMAIHAFAV